jgi:uncharacterized repeat protein (TIGR01451 family)
MKSRWSLIASVFGLGLALAAGLVAFISQAAPGNPVIEPARNTHTAPPTTTVSITYDEPISAATVSTQTFAVHAMQTGLLTRTYGVNGGTIALTPTQSFKPGELVQVSATTATLNVTGEQPIRATVWQFLTAVSGGSARFPIGNNFGTVSGSALALALGDVDGDGDLDLVVGNWEQQNRIYLNGGDGTFDTTSYDIGPADDATRALALGDLDGDGDLDLAVGNQAEQNVVYINDGYGNPFDAATHAFGTGMGYSYALALGDLDGDGDLDLAVGHWGQQNALYLNDGDGTFDTTWYYFGPPDHLTSDLALGDLDGDGDLDLAVGNWGQQDVVYPNDGIGNPFDAVTYTVGPGDDATYALALGDVNDDGELDLAIGNEGEQNTVYYNDGVINPFDTISAPVGSGGDATYALALGDVDGDGDLDLVVGNVYQQNVVYLNDGFGNPFDTSTIAIGAGNDATYALVPGDVDGDGDLDLAVGNDGQSVIYLNQFRADLAISKSFERGFGSITYTIEAQNLGPTEADGAIVSDTVPSHIIGVTWTCVAASGASCTASGSGNAINDTLSSFPPGGVVTYTVNGLLGVLDHATNAAAVIPSAGVFDPDSSNNSDTADTRYRMLLPLVFLNGQFLQGNGVLD